MEIPELSKFACNFSVMVRIQGPDPKGLKMRNHAFHLHQSGTTSLSASGLLLPPGSLSDPPKVLEHILSIYHHAGALVITVASVIEPFLTAQHRDNPTKDISPKLIPGACIDVLVEGEKEVCSVDNPGSLFWVPSNLLAIVDVSAASDALLSLIGAHGGPSEQTSWDLSWSLPPLGNDPKFGGSDSYRQVENDLRLSDISYRSSSLDKSNNATIMAKAATRLAFLGVSAALDIKFQDVLNLSQPQERGDFLLVMGSPFGVLSPFHFYNSISVGTVSNCFPSSSSFSSLLMADIHCFPGMEGAPVFDKQGFLTGILTRPLRQRGGIAEIQLVMAWHAIETSGSNELLKESQRVQSELSHRNIHSAQNASIYSSSNVQSSVKYLHGHSASPSLSQCLLEKGISSIALVTVGDDVWASGVVLNNHGLILTNAHILEPSRFGGTSLPVKTDRITTASFERKSYISMEEENADKEGGYDDSVTNGHEPSFLNSNYRSYKRVSVRLQHIWYDAEVIFVSKGPWDVALLQIKFIPNQLCPITPEFACPAIGSTIHVIGHGLLGPRSEISPSISSGVIANVVKIPGHIHHHESGINCSEKNNTPVMLQTTAAVHPGASGGAVFNSDGRFIGLVTSNARHGGGTIIPHLNFSIPCAVLEPIFTFSEEQNLSRLQVLDHQNELSYLQCGLWFLHQPQCCRLGRKKIGTEAKGSRFSLFLSEQKDQKQFIMGKFSSKM